MKKVLCDTLLCLHGGDEVAQIESQVYLQFERSTFVSLYRNFTPVDIKLSRLVHSLVRPWAFAELCEKLKSYCRISHRD
jgi:hypothetical protein